MSAENDAKYLRMREMKRVEMQSHKATAVISELEFKIIEREEDIQRMKDHIEVQKKIKSDSDAEFKKMSEQE